MVEVAVAKWSISLWNSYMAIVKIEEKKKNHSTMDEESYKENIIVCVCVFHVKDVKEEKQCWRLSLVGNVVPVRKTLCFARNVSQEEMNGMKKKCAHKNMSRMNRERMKRKERKKKCSKEMSKMC